MSTRLHKMTILPRSNTPDTTIWAELFSKSISKTILPLPHKATAIWVRQDTRMHFILLEFSKKDSAIWKSVRAPTGTVASTVKSTNISRRILVSHSPFYFYTLLIGTFKESSVSILRHTMTMFHVVQEKASVFLFGTCGNASSVTGKPSMNEASNENLASIRNFQTSLSIGHPTGCGDRSRVDTSPSRRIDHGEIFYFFLRSNHFLGSKGEISHTVHKRYCVGVGIVQHHVFQGKGQTLRLSFFD
mmetsp:Transcript_22040/g.35470  ORF Transcript_22040/g.35470 Transcript_22040/m.35470 type:complete len:245 (-) Transcript_22040:261-995(-)